ncbi:hypothetical protein [Chromobacterium haemolyticum]|uniref:hypothetical protein n=1 Tax=Chromobacterium haemolyticum TaxID=394935 RepID=UPI0011303E71|nr:hypothetical protein [Chromobacterium haemolyticum]
MSRKISSCLFLVFWSFPVVAGISVDPIEMVVVDAGKKSPVFKVKAEGSKKEFVKISVHEIKNPATPEELEVQPAEWGALVVTPQKLILEPRSHKIVRVASILPQDDKGLKERVFRVRFSPVDGERESEGGFESQLGINATLGVSISWGALVRLVPKKQKVDFALQPDGGLRNTGNVRFRVKNLRMCVSGNDCKPHKFTERNLYPDQVMILGDSDQIKYMRFIIQPDNKEPKEVVADELLAKNSE